MKLRRTLNDLRMIQTETVTCNQRIAEDPLGTLGESLSSD